MVSDVYGKESFMANFEEMDTDGDKALTFEEVRKFCQKNAKKYGDDSAWKTILDFGPVLMMAHKVAASHSDSSSSVYAKKTVDITEMKALFIHCYVFCILYEHFALGHTEDALLFKKKIDLFEFRMACDSLNSLHSHEICDERSIGEDFVFLDTNYTGKLGFITICTHAERYIDSHSKADIATPLGHHLVSTVSSKQCKAARILGIVDSGNAKDRSNIGDLSNGPKQIYTGLKTQEKTEIAMMQFHSKVLNELASVRRHHEVRLWKDCNPGQNLPPELCGALSLKSPKQLHSSKVKNKAPNSQSFGEDAEDGSAFRKVMDSLNKALTKSDDAFQQREAEKQKEEDEEKARARGLLSKASSTKSITLRISSLMGRMAGVNAAVAPTTTSTGPATAGTANNSPPSNVNANGDVDLSINSSTHAGKASATGTGKDATKPDSRHASLGAKLAADLEFFALSTPLPDDMTIENMAEYNRKEALRLQQLEELKAKQAQYEKERVQTGPSSGVMSAAATAGPATTTASGAPNKYAHLLGNTQRAGFHVPGPPQKKTDTV